MSISFANCVILEQIDKKILHTSIRTCGIHWALQIIIISKGSPDTGFQNRPKTEVAKIVTQYNVRYLGKYKFQSIIDGNKKLACIQIFISFWNESKDSGHFWNYLQFRWYETYSSIKSIENCYVSQSSHSEFSSFCRI